MNDSVNPASMKPVIRIGIRGLPNLTNHMISGGLYVLIAETPSARFPMLAGSLGSALKDEFPCTVIVPANPDLFIQRIESFGNINAQELIAARRLQLFTMQDEFAKKMFRFGAESFVQELDHFEIPENSYLLFDQADELLSLHDISLALDQVDIIGKWLAQRKVTALLVFSRVTATYSGTINALMDSLTGIARLGGDRDGLELTFDYWRSPEGAIAARHYQLLTLESGHYEASTKAAPSSQAIAEDNGEPNGEVEDAEPHFFYMDPDLDSLAKQVPGIWQRTDTLVGMMHATRNTRSATAILCFQHDTNLRQLAETVHTLRLSLGHRAQIVVQEKGASLRYQNEALLLRLGINLVVHRDVPTSRLPLLLESLIGQIFSRDVDINFEAALASVAPTRLRGYLLPLRFAREAAVILDRAATLNIPCAMIIGKPEQGTTMVEILTHIGLSRPGDLITADNEYCYLFLNACQQTVMLATLERIIGASVDTIFEDIRFLVRREEIHPELAALSRAAEHSELPDYSSLIGTSPAQASSGESTLEELQPPANVPAKRAAPFLTAMLQSEQETGALPDEPVLTLSARPSIAPAPRFPTAPMVTPTMARLATPKEASLKVLDTQAEGSGSNQSSARHAPAFGKKEAPRATRSAPPVAFTNTSNEDATAPTGF